MILTDGLRDLSVCELDLAKPFSPSIHVHPLVLDPLGDL